MLSSSGAGRSRRSPATWAVEEIQWDWFERRNAPWGGTAYVLLGTLPHSGRIRGVLAEKMDQDHLVSAMDAVLRRLGGTPRVWRTDRLATVIVPGTAEVQASFAPVAKHSDVSSLPSGNHPMLQQQSADLPLPFVATTCQLVEPISSTCPRRSLLATASGYRPPHHTTPSFPPKSALVNDPPVCARPGPLGNTWGSCDDAIPETTPVTTPETIPETSERLMTPTGRSGMAGVGDRSPPPPEAIRWLPRHSVTPLSVGRTCRL